jgi:hypothetical protein
VARTVLRGETCREALTYPTPFTPSLLRYDRFGHALPVTLDPWDDPESMRLLPEDEAAAYWPDLAKGQARRKRG